VIHPKIGRIKFPVRERGRGEGVSHLYHKGADLEEV
jgi:hypothetical protein